MKNYHSILIILLFVAIFGSCMQKPKVEEAEEVKITTQSYVAKGDSMLYGLACDGCNDTLLVLLPDSGGDPVNYDITRARREHRVFGMPRIGDKMAVMVNSENPKELLMVVDVEQVKGSWYYTELPQLKRKMSKADSLALTKLKSEDRQRLDSFIASYMVPREYVYNLKRDYTVMTEGGPPRTTSLDNTTPVEYPKMRRYSEWHIFNGKIIFSYGGVKIEGYRDSVAFTNDTAEFVLLRRDTMALKFADRVQGYKLRPDTTEQKPK